MISDKVKKKIDKEWAASKAIVFDWKSAPDEDAAYMMSLYVKDIDKKEYDPEFLLKFVKILRHGQYTVPSYKVSPSSHSYIARGTVNGKEYRVNWDLGLEYEGTKYDIINSNSVFHALLEFGFTTLTVSSTFERISYNQFEARKAEYQRLKQILIEAAPALIEAYAAKARPVKKVHKKVVENLVRIIRDCFNRENQARIESIEGIVWMMQNGKYETEIEDFLTALRRNKDSVNALTPELWKEVKDLLIVQDVSNE